MASTAESALRCVNVKPTVAEVHNDTPQRGKNTTEDVQPYSGKPSAIPRKRSPEAEVRARVKFLAQARNTNTPANRKPVNLTPVQVHSRPTHTGIQITTLDARSHAWFRREIEHYSD